MAEALHSNILYLLVTSRFSPLASMYLVIFPTLFQSVPKDLRAHEFWKLDALHEMRGFLKEAVITG